MHNIYDKATLYLRIEEHRNRLGICNSDYPINIKEVCSNSKHIVVRECPFKTPGLRGIATKRTVFDGTDIILLNSNRNENEKNFDCGHEMIHLLEHRNAKAQTFHCFEKTMPNQNSFMEWQANEGSAELIVPYRKFITDFCSDIKLAIKMGINYERNINAIPEVYADNYKVTPSFIRNRIRNLQYEICQHYHGTAINNLDIKSRHQLKSQGIDLNQYDIFSFVRLI
jgi:Zn-dependent peptidase ImmA (M78 family)